MAAHDMAAGSVSVQTTGGKPSSAFRCVCCSARKERQGFLVLKQCLSSDTIGCATTTPFSAFCCVSTLPTAFLSLPSTVPTAFLSLPFSVSTARFSLPFVRCDHCLSSTCHRLSPRFVAIAGSRRRRHARAVAVAAAAGMRSGQLPCSVFPCVCFSAVGSFCQAVRHQRDAQPCLIYLHVISLDA